MIGNHAGRRQHHAEQDGDDDVGRIPGYHSRNDHRGHADVVHHADAQADHGAAGSDHRVLPVDHLRPAEGVDAISAALRLRNLDRNQVTDCGHADGDDQRRQRQRRVVGGRKARVVGQHGNEVRRPDSRAGAEARQSDPRQAAIAMLLRTPRVGSARKDVEGSEGRHGADERRKNDEPQIVFGRHATQNADQGSLRAKILPSTYP